MKSKILPVIVTAAVTTVATLLAFSKLYTPKPYFGMAEERKNSMTSFASFENGGTVRNAQSIDFQMAAEGSVKAVVHVKTQTKARMVQADDYFGRMFGQQYYIPQQEGSGSGVVISPDGYIVTNNHVVANADAVTVTFNDRLTAEAKVISKDPTTDIAVLKVNQKNLPYLEFGNSDNVHLGQWVLAVGYPLTLDATVTAGIVSAKGRSIGINKQQANNAIESFIQTDAAVNPGNSGGALVNTDGQLIGINSAIASPTGSYAGYSYAIPSNLVRKVVNDLVQFGKLQRGYLGTYFLDKKDATPEQLTGLELDKNEGVYVDGIAVGSAAEKAGLKTGDFITQINNIPVNSETEVREQIARYRPGDNLNISYSRNGAKKSTVAQLLNLENTIALEKENTTKALGAKFRALSNDEKKKYEINNGIAIADVGNGLLAQARIKKDFVIITANDIPINGAVDLEKAFEASEVVQLAGFYPGYKGMYYYTIRAR
jgi:Do/DeqQ family serine protease